MTKFNGKKGITIVELTVGLVIVIMLSFCVVTLTTMVNNRAESNSKKIAFMQDANKAEYLLEYWLNDVLSNDATAEIKPKNQDGYKFLSTSKGFITYLGNKGILRARLTSGEDMEVELAIVTAVDFSIATKESFSVVFSRAFPLIFTL